MQRTRSAPTRRLLAWAAALVVSACALSMVPSTAQAQKKSKTSIKLILNDPNGRTAPMNRCDREVCSSLEALIKNAKTSIDFAIYGMRDQEAILRALEDAKKRGVKIRGVIDRDSDGKNYYTSTELMVKTLGNIESDLQSELQLAELAAERQARFGKFKPQCERPAGFEGPLQCLAYDIGEQCLFTAHASREELNNSGAIMHNKYFVIDKRYVWAGSTNVSDSGTGGYNANLVTVTDSAKVASWFTREFEAMYSEGKFHDFKRPSGNLRTTLDDGAKIQVLFSPQDKPITNAVRPMLQGAKKSIDVAIFFLTHKGIARDLINAHKRGVKVRVIMDATAAKNGYAKHEIVRAAGIPLKIEHWGGKMHAKSAVIDNKIVITGSMNWTSAGEGGNDENTTIITSPKHAKKYTAWFNTIWKSIPDKWLKGRPDPESMDSPTACKDGVDNDYDHKADKKDPGCGKNPPPLPEGPPMRLVPKEDGEGLVKIVGDRYYTKDHPDYDTVAYDRLYCSERAARDDGYKRTRKTRKRRDETDPLLDY